MGSITRGKVLIGATADRPTASEVGRLYWDSTTAKLYQDTGSTWQEVTAAATTTIKTVVIDFGSTPTYENRFTITDTAILEGSHIMAQIAYEPTTGRDADEVEMEPFTLMAGPNGAGSMFLFLTARDGPVDGKYKVSYLIG